MSGSAQGARCAIYTRKSTEHNLDLEFNSLDAQREACEAYVRSQKHEGWKLLSERYDDGGLSGASLQRPELQRLLNDIRAGKVNTVVVYKVDRLTRSLTDFAKLVELFDTHNVSFVSITQSFNTTTSMGRLTLNVLLSFAQFEREVIGERVRDKVSASKRKGMWMGGSVPLGYEVQNKKLVVLPREADAVRHIYRRYLELGAVGPLLAELRATGIRTKSRKGGDGLCKGEGSFGKGALLYLLKNRTYVAEIEHKGEIHPADHEPVLDRAIFDAVQDKLRQNNVEQRLKLKASPYLLTGVIFDGAGNRMTPTHTLKKGVRYRYYLSQAVIQHRSSKEDEKTSRVPAPEIEALVERHLQARLPDDAGRISREVLILHVRRVTVHDGAVELEFTPSGSETADRPTSISVPWHRRPSRAAKGIIAGAYAHDNDRIRRANEIVLKAVAKARNWVDQVLEGTTIQDIAKKEGKGERQIRLLMPLAFMPPSTVKLALDGRYSFKTVTEEARRVPLTW